MMKTKTAIRMGLPIQWDRYPQKRGDICVLRYSWGELECLRIEPQSNYKEWPGCFSLIRDSGAIE